jgi:hypothetical protein
MTPKKKVALKILQRLWAKHDRLERQIIHIERLFTDQELDRILER